MIRIPKRLKKRPQYRGLPIPYIAYIGDDGQPDFRITDEAKRLTVMRNVWCQLCGEPLGRSCFFVGGTEAAKHNQYFEPACHLDCLIYAMQVCPFIAGKLEHAELDKVQARHKEELAKVGVGGLIIKTDETFTAVKNPYWVIKKANGWRIGQTSEGTILLLPNALKETQPLHAETMTGADWKKVYEWLLA